MLLARALLVLACAAALVAADEKPKSKCVTKTIGTKNKEPVIKLPAVVIKKGVKESTINIPNKCDKNGIQWEEIVACDEDVAPEVTLPPKGAFSPVKVTRKGKLLTTATVDVRQACKGKRE